jgi:nucleotide-binding universal stress UspA family protein
MSIGTAFAAILATTGGFAMTTRVQIRRILAPTDFSEPSRIAFAYAVTVARWYEAEITVAHVLPSVLAYPEPAWPATAAPVEIRARALAELERWSQPARAAGVRSSAVIVDGDAATEIVSLASSAAADMIVMGTRGRGGFEAAILGSVSASVLRKAACPVLTVSGSSRVCEGPGERPFRRILCALDLTAPSSDTFNFALSLAQESDASLAVLHVLERRGHRANTRAGADVDEGSLVEDARERLRSLVPAEARDWCDIAELARIGDVSGEILAVARDQRVGLVVMGAHGARPIDALCFGSAARDVVREAPCPVLTLPHRARRSVAAGPKAEFEEELSLR